MAKIAAPLPNLHTTDGGSVQPGRVFCVGRNYAEHALEMGHDPTRERPFFFGKAPQALTQGGVVLYPSRTRELHHEIELVVVMGTGGRDIPLERALDHVFGYAVGIDLTRRDLQAEAKQLRRPWYLAKSFIGAAPVTPIVPKAEAPRIDAGRIRLEVNGEPRQEGDLARMIWSVPELVRELSSYDELLPGDVIFTGTPAGVGPCLPGDELEGGIEGIGDIYVNIAGG